MLERGRHGRSRGRADALHGDALLPRPGRHRKRPAREEKLFRRFKAEESAQAITAKRRLLSPEDNNERQPIHEHESVPLETHAADGRVDRDRRRLALRPISRSTLKVFRSSSCSPPSPWRPRLQASGAGRHLHRRHRRLRHQVHAQQRPAGQEVPARDAGLRRARSSTPTATAGSTSCWSTAATGRRAGATPCPRSTGTISNGTFTNITAGSGLDVEIYGMGVAVGRLRQRRPRGRLHHRARRRPAVPQRGRAASSGT